MLAIVALWVAINTQQGASVWGVLKEAQTEVRKVVWPTRQETNQTTLIVVALVILMAFISVVSYKMGLEEGISVTVFPMIIISWTIERTSIMWEEHGGQEVMEKMGGSLLISIIVYFVMTNNFIKYITFTFPEVMLIMLALVLLIGVYTGYRLTELFRFEPLVKDEDIKS